MFPIVKDKEARAREMGSHIGRENKALEPEARGFDSEARLVLTFAPWSRIDPDGENAQFFRTADAFPTTLLGNPPKLFNRDY